MNLQSEFKNINVRLERIESYTAPTEQEQETLGEWFDEWLDMYKIGQIKASTLYQYRLMIRKIPENILSKPIGKITSKELQLFLYKIKKTRQRQHVYCILKDTFNKAFALQMIEHNPMLAIECPKHIKKQRKAFTHEQEARFVEACKNDKYGDVFLIMLYSGIRKGEALALESTDIDLHNNRIHITKGINDLNCVDTPKSKAGFRKVPILKELLPYIQKYAVGARKRLFAIRENTAHIHFHSILEEAGLKDQGFTTHSLRHTFITRLCEKRVPLKVAQKWAGHSDAKLTLNIYSHCNDDFEEESLKC